MINLGANLSARNVLGHTPLHVAASHGAIETLTLLASSVPTAVSRSEDGFAWRHAWLDNAQRSPEDAVLAATGADVVRCAALLRAVQITSDGTNLVE